MSPWLFILTLATLVSIGQCFQFPFKTTCQWHRKSHGGVCSNKVVTTTSKKWTFSVAASKTDLTEITPSPSSEQKIGQKGRVIKDRRKEAALERSARKLAAERGPNYVELSHVEEFQRLMATLQSTPLVKKGEKSRSKRELSGDDIEHLTKGVENSADVVGKTNKRKRAKKTAAAAADAGDDHSVAEEHDIKKMESEEDRDSIESLRTEKDIPYVVESPGVRSEKRQRGTRTVGSGLRKSPTWRLPSDPAQVRTQQRMSKIHHIGVEGTYTVPAGGGGGASYEGKGREKDGDPLQQEPGIYLKNHFGPYVDPGERWTEKDEDGVTIKDPVELRNRRRNRPAAADSTHSTHHNGLYEGGNILMKEAPDVDPSELQDLDPFQRSVWYSGGRPVGDDDGESTSNNNDNYNRNSFWGRRTFNQSHQDSSREVDWDPFDERSHEEGYAEPQEKRAIINAVITNSSTNCTALEVVRKVYDFIKNGTDNDPRIDYQINCYCVDDEAYPGMENLIQMWLESYNTYHLIDGLAMREAWGCIMPHIVLGQRNLGAILDQVKFALAEDAGDGTLLSPRFRTIRLQGGGKQEMDMGYNNQRLTTKFSVVNTR